MAKIFISYRRDDSPWPTGRIYDRLKDRFGPENVFFDVDSIPLGVDFREHLDEKIKACDLVLAVIGWRRSATPAPVWAWTQTAFPTSTGSRSRRAIFCSARRRNASFPLPSGSPGIR